MPGAPKRRQQMPMSPQGPMPSTLRILLRSNVSLRPMGRNENGLFSSFFHCLGCWWNHWEGELHFETALPAACDRSLTIPVPL